MTLSMPELAGKRITLSYIPAGEDDAALIEEYGGITNVPAYLVEMKPVIMVNGEVIATGGAETLGERQQFVMDFITPGGGRDRVANDVTVGAYYAVGLDLGKVPLRQIEERRAKLAQWSYLINSSFIETTSIKRDDIAGEILYITALSYFLELDKFTEMISKSKNLVRNRQTSEAVVSMNLNVNYLFWSPYSVNPAGMAIDVDRDIYSPFSITGNKNDTKSYMISSGMLGSTLEHSILEQIYQVPSVSALKIIQIANDRGVPIYIINSTNVNDVLPKLQVSGEIKSGIINEVTKGKIVTIPEHNIQFNSWKGLGWIIIDPESGAGAYMISGSLAGGGWSGCVKDLGVWFFGSLPKNIGILISILAAIAGISKAYNDINGAQMFLVLFLAIISIAFTYIIFLAGFLWIIFFLVLLVNLLINFTINIVLGNTLNEALPCGET